MPPPAVLDAVLVAAAAVLAVTAYTVLVTREPFAAAPLRASTRATKLANAGLARYYSDAAGVEQGVYLAQTPVDAACTYGDAAMLDADRCAALYLRANDVTACTHVAGRDAVCGASRYPVRVGLARYVIERMDIAAKTSAADAARLALFRPCMVAAGGGELAPSSSWFGSAPTFTTKHFDSTSAENGVATGILGKGAYSLRYLAPVDALDAIVATAPGMACNQFSIVYGPTAARSGFSATTVPGFAWDVASGLTAKTAGPGGATSTTRMDANMSAAFRGAFGRSAVRHIVCCVSADIALACFLCTDGSDGTPMCHIEVTTGVPAWKGTVDGLRAAAVSVRATTECVVDQPGIAHFLAVPSLYHIARALGYAFS